MRTETSVKETDIERSRILLNEMTFDEIKEVFHNESLYISLSNFELGMEMLEGLKTDLGLSDLRTFYGMCFETYPHLYDELCREHQ